MIAQPFPEAWEQILLSRVAFYNALEEGQRTRFRQMVAVFLDETRITGIRTEVDHTTRVLVAASAVIPVLRLPGWEYAGLGEVLIYPDSFNEHFQTDSDNPRQTLGLVHHGAGSSVMILSKPALLAGFNIHTDKRNVGLHEFAHIIDGADGVIDGVPANVPAGVELEWIQWVARELADPPDDAHVRPYGYTNEAEYFAVLVEYFFEAPEVLERKDPKLYRMLQRMFNQDTARFLPGIQPRRPRRIGRNRPCPCGSGRKYKKCCLLKARGAAKQS